jgi:hypothetical protein
MRHVETRIVSILVSFREIHVPTQQHALLTTINLFVLALQDMKRMHMDNVLQSKRENVIMIRTVLMIRRALSIVVETLAN